MELTETTTEETITDTSVDEETAEETTTRLDRAEAALAALDEPEEDEILELDSEDSDEESESEESESEEPKEEEPEVEEKVEEEPEPPGHKWQALRRREAKLKAEQASVAEQQAQLKSDYEAAVKQVQPVLHMQKLMRSDPEAFLEQLATASGTTAAAFYDRLTDTRLNDGKPTESELLNEIRAMREQHQQEINAIKNGLSEREMRAAQSRAHAAIENMVDQAVTGNVVLEDGSSASLEARWPNLDLMEPQARGARVREGIRWAAEKAPHLTLPELMTHLDEIQGMEYSYVQQRLAARGQIAPSASPKTSEGQRDPAQSANPNSGNGKTLSNSLAAQRSSGATYRDEAPDRIDSAAATLPDNLLDMF